MKLGVAECHVPTIFLRVFFLKGCVATASESGTCERRSGKTLEMSALTAADGTPGEPPQVGPLISGSRTTNFRQQPPPKGPLK